MEGSRFGEEKLRLAPFGPRLAPRPRTRSPRRPRPAPQAPPLRLTLPPAPRPDREALEPSLPLAGHRRPGLYPPRTLPVSLPRAPLRPTPCVPCVPCVSVRGRVGRRGSSKRPAAGAARGAGGAEEAAAAMAEASPQPGRYFCHCCSVEIVPRLPVSPRAGGGSFRPEASWPQQGN